MKIIDCNVHHFDPTQEEWLAYLEEAYRTELSPTMRLRRTGSGIRSEDRDNRWDVSITKPVDDGNQHLNAERVIWTGVYGATASSPDPEYPAALCRADHDCATNNWLPVDHRFTFGIRVPLQNPQMAV